MIERETGWYDVVTDIHHAMDWEEYFSHRLRELNIYDAGIDAIEWAMKTLEKDGRNGLRVADIGCGTGWLSAYLSQRSEISEIYSVDSDLSVFKPDCRELEVMFPERDLEKIKSVSCCFSGIDRILPPLDLVIYCASIHHSESLRKQIETTIRCLNEDGCIVLINEDFYGMARLSLLLVKSVMSSVKRGQITRSVKMIKDFVVHSSFMYDDVLGDHAYKPGKLENVLWNVGMSVRFRWYPHSAYKGSSRHPKMFAVIGRKR